VALIHQPFISSVLVAGIVGTGKLGAGESLTTACAFTFNFDFSMAEVIAKKIKTTEKVKEKIINLEVSCCDITRNVETTKIQASETGIKTFQPNFINWS
jgi:hypothetical protein